MIRLKEIAEDCGVNVSTVSRALKDDPRVKSDTRKKIHAAASRMGYTPNWAAQSLKGAKTNTIWLLIADLFNPLTAQLATYCSHELAQAGFDLSVILYHNSQVRYEHLLRRLHFGITDGALIVGSRNFNSFKKPNFDNNQINLKECCQILKKRGELIDDLRHRSFPTIFLDRFERETQLPIVTTNHIAAISALLDNLLVQSPDLVVDLFCPDENMVEYSRQQALLNFLKVRHQSHQSLSSNPINQISPGKKVAIVASSEVRVKEFLEKKAKDLENREILIGVFDQWLGNTAPFLEVFVCQQDFNLMAHQACTLLISKIQNPNIKIPVNTRIPFKFLIKL